MADLTTPFFYNTRGRGSVARNPYPVENAQVIYVGALVGLNAGGFLIHWGPDVAANRFLGYAVAHGEAVDQDDLDNGRVTGDSSATPDPDLVVNEGGDTLERISVVGVAGQLDVGAGVFATDDQTFTLTPPTLAEFIGRVVRFHSGTIVDVELVTPAEYEASVPS